MLGLSIFCAPLVRPCAASGAVCFVRSDISVPGGILDIAVFKSALSADKRRPPFRRSLSPAGRQLRRRARFLGGRGRPGFGQTRKRPGMRPWTAAHSRLQLAPVAWPPARLRGCSCCPSVSVGRPGPAAPGGNPFACRVPRPARARGVQHPFHASLHPRYE